MSTPAPKARFVYLVFSHRRPAQVERLLRRILELSPDSAVILHHDGHVEPMQWTDPPDSRIHVFDAQPIIWGEYSQVTARLQVLRYLHDHVPHDWSVTISGQDYPVRDLSQWQAHVSVKDLDYILDARPVNFGPGAPRRVLMQDECFARYAFRWSPLGPTAKHILPTVNRVARVFNVDPVMVKRSFKGTPWLGLARRTIFSPDWRCYKGMVSMALSAKALARVQSVLAARPEIERYYSTTLFPAESLLPTVLSNEHDLRGRQGHVSFTIWEAESSPHPVEIGPAEIDAALSSGAPFARKLDIDTGAAAFDALDAALGAS